jgi:uncharacterized coiled-coil DUF342 family protein
LVSVTTALLTVLLVFASALCGVGIWALTESVKTARSARRLADDLDERLVPLLDKADVTVDAMNAELLRIDQIVTRVEEVTDRVSDTSRAVQEVANAPGEIVNDLADRVRRAWKTRKQPHRESAEAVVADEPESEPSEPPSAEEDLSPH